MRVELGRRKLDLGYGLNLWVDGKHVDSIRVAYSDRFEIRVLEAVFPKTHWSGSNEESEFWFKIYPSSKGGRTRFTVAPGNKGPPVFDFVGNEAKAKAAMQDYFDEQEWLDDDPEHDTRPKWEQTFWRMYKTGMALQLQGKEVRVDIG